MCRPPSPVFAVSEVRGPRAPDERRWPEFGKRRAHPEDDNVTEPSIETFDTSDGYRHHFRHWVPQQSRPKGIVVALHGIQSHSGWYTFSSGALCAAGYEVLFLDRRGSGMNADERGHARHADRLVNDIVQVLQSVRRRRNADYPTVPLILSGLSWGGKLAAVVASRRPELIDALVLLYPGIHSQFQLNEWDHFRLNLARFGDVLQKRVPLPLGDPKLFTNDDQWRDFIARDNLALHDATVSFLLANRDLDEEAQRVARSLRCPTLMALAGRDRIINNDAMRTYFAQIGTESKSLLEYPQACHTLEFEPNRQAFVDDQIRWLNQLPEVAI